MQGAFDLAPCAPAALRPGSSGARKAAAAGPGGRRQCDHVRHPESRPAPWFRWQIRRSPTALPTPWSAYVAYLGKMLWPAGLAVFYPFEPPLPGGSRWCAAGCSGRRSASRCWWRRARYPYLLAGWLWYLGTLVPVIGLVRVGGHAMADRYTYVPLIGIFIIAAWGIPDLLRRLAAAAGGLRRGRRCRAWRLHGADVAPAAVCGRTRMHLFQHALAVTRNNYIAHFMIGTVLLEQGGAMRRSVNLPKPCASSRPITKPTSIWGSSSRRAVNAKRRSSITSPRCAANPFIEAHNSLAVVLAAQGDIDGAMAHYREAIRLDPDFGAAHNNLAATLAAGQTDEAIVQYTDAIRLAPQHAEPHWNLAVVLQGAGRLSEAIEQFRTALQLNPHLVEMRYRLATRMSKPDRGAKPKPSSAGAAGTARMERGGGDAGMAAGDSGRRAPARRGACGAARRRRRAAHAAARCQRAEQPGGRLRRNGPLRAGNRRRHARARRRRQQRQTALRDALAVRLALYRAGQPVREPPGAQHP